METPDYGRHTVARGATKGMHGYKGMHGHKPAHAYKPSHDHHPKHAKGPKAIEPLSGDAIETVRRQRMCGDILSEPAGYDPALVQLCRRVSSR